MSDGATPMYRADNLEDRDHQLVGELNRAGSLNIDYFECVVPSFPRIVC
jgi:uncharacterized protein YmfQ (DUF2313 family)